MKHQRSEASVWAGRRDTLEAMIMLTLAKLCIAVVPLRWYAFTLGDHTTIVRSPADPRDAAVALRVRRAVRAAVKRLPWTAVCLPQATAAQWMLRRRGVPATMYLGARRDASGTLDAHAWVRVGPLLVTGDAELDRFDVVAAFA